MIPSRGRYALDLSKEVILGHEPLWNSTGWQRGSILVLVNDVSNIEFGKLFENSHSPSVSNNPNTGESPGAVRLALREAARGRLVVLFPASNGVEWATIVPPPELSGDVLREAERKFIQVDMKDCHAEWFNT